MSLEIIRSGILDTVQDNGRCGHQHLGINPSGAMDRTALRIANALVGNKLDEGVIEMGFPAAAIKFHASTLISLAGANFSAEVNGQPLPVGKLCQVPSGAQLHFTKNTFGRFVYLAVRGGFSFAPWLNSLSANLKVSAGSVGRALKKGDVLMLNQSLSNQVDLKMSKWAAKINWREQSPVRCMPGTEWNELSDDSQQHLVSKSFSISPLSDRMGYRLQGAALQLNHRRELLSTAVTFGTVQLLPNGQMICLMADHQTTGGYPRVLQVALVDLPKVAQLNPNDPIRFQLIRVEEAEELYLKSIQQIRQIESSCKMELQSFLK
jgi:antagonist of KipI